MTGTRATCIYYTNQIFHAWLCFFHSDHITIEEIWTKIQQAIGPHEDLLTIVKRCKLKWYGHVSRSSGLAKTILQGTEPTDNQTTQRPPMTIKKHMLQRHGHVSCLSGLAKTVLQGTVKGGRRHLPFIRSGQNHLARHSERGKKTRQTEKEVGR